MEILSDIKGKNVENEEIHATRLTWERMKEYWTRDSRRSIKNWRMYWALDPELGLGQWPDQAVAQMVQQQRQLTQYNLTMTLIDTIAGGIMQSMWDPKFYPVASGVNSLTKIVQAAAYSDKELMDWPAAFFEVFRAGLIHEGGMKIVVDSRYDDLGNIGFEYCQPGSLIKDPAWKTWNGRDCKQCFHESWLSYSEFAETYPEWADYARAMGGIEKLFGPEYGLHEGVTNKTTITDNRWGSFVRVVEHYYMQVDKVRREYAVDFDERGIPHEVTIPERMKDASEKISWLNNNVPNWAPDKVFEKTANVPCSYVKTFCPDVSLNTLVAKGKTRLQIERLPFFWYAASRANGESHSIVDSICDAQQTLNYWESLITHKLQIEGGGGAQYVDPSKFESQAEYMRWRQQRNNPTESFAVKTGGLDAGAVSAPIVKSAFPNEAYEHIRHIVEVMIPWISKVTRVTRGEKEGSTDSGRLFELMKIQSDQQLYTIHYGVRLFYNEVYESYLLAAADVYGRYSVPRAFSVDGGRETLVMNEIINKPDGTIVIRNDASRLREMRHKVIISEQASSPTERLAQISGVTQMLKVIPPEKAGTRHFLLNRAIASMEVFQNEEDKAALEVIGQEELAVIVADMRMKKAQMRLQELEATARAKQLEEAQKMQQAQKEQQAAGASQAPQGQPPAVGPADAMQQPGQAQEQVPASLQGQQPIAAGPQPQAAAPMAPQ